MKNSGRCTSKYRHVVPVRRRRRLAGGLFGLVVLMIALAVIALVLIFDRLPVPDVEPTPEHTVPMHIITMEPEETPEPGPVRYPVPLEDELQDWIILQCGEDIDPALVLAVIAVETAGTWNPEAVGDNGNSIGLMQIFEGYHGDRMRKLGVFDLKDPYQNTAVGIDVLRELSAGGRDEAWVLMAYNGGTAYADGRLEMGDISAYARKVLLLKGIYDESIQGF